MKSSIKAVVFLSMWLVVPSLSFSVDVKFVEDSHCLNWGDNLEQSQVAGRVDFALGCEQDPKMIYSIKMFSKGIYAVGGTDKTPGYPTYGVFNPEADGDFFGHPGDWRAPLTKTPCEIIPKGYNIVFFCASGRNSPEQSMLFPEGSQNIGYGMEKAFKLVMTLF